MRASTGQQVGEGANLAVMSSGEHMQK